MKKKSKTEEPVEARARDYCDAALKVIARVMERESEPGLTQLKAAQAMLDRGCGQVRRGAKREAQAGPRFGRIERVIVGPGYEKASKKTQKTLDQAEEGAGASVAPD